MRAKSFDLLRPKLKGAWQKAAGKDAGSRLNEEAERQFERVDLCYRAVLGMIAAALVAGLSAELDEMLASFHFALQTDEDAYARERERLWYVACSRARDLLVIPELPAPDQRSWARIIDLGLGELPILNVSALKR